MSSPLIEGLAQRVLRLSSGPSSNVVGWRALGDATGHEIDRLLRRRVLIELPPPACWSCCDRCEGECEGRWIGRKDGVLSAVCPLDGADRIPLDPLDLRLFEIDPKQLVTAIREDSGLVGKGPEALVEGLWCLGHPTPPAPPTLVVLAFETAFDALPEAIDCLKRLAGAAVVTVLTAGDLRLAVCRQLDDAGIRVVSAVEAIATDMPAQFRLNPEMLVRRLVEARLVIAKGARTVAVHGRPVQLTPTPLRLILYLGQKAQGTDAWIEVRDIERAIWGTKAPVNGAADQIRRVRDAIKAAFADGELPNLIEAGTNSYRINPEFRPVAVRP